MKKLIPFIIIAPIIIVAFLIINNSKETSEEKPLMEASVQDFAEIEDAEHHDHEHDHEHDHSVEIEGSEIKQLTIQQIADLWQIDSKELLDEIIQEFDFQEDYTTETILEDMRNEYKFSPAIIKDIAEEMKK